MTGWIQEVWSIAFLMLALVSVWLHPATLWVIPFVIFVVTGLGSGWIEPSALVSMTLLAWILVASTRARKVVSRRITLGLVIVLSLLFGLHVLPGFERAEFFTELEVPNRPAFSGVSFSADKAVLGLFLLLAYRDRLCHKVPQWRNAMAKTAAPVIVGILGVYLAAILTNTMAFEPVPLDSAFWLLLSVLLMRNLFFTVIAEEMLFRPILQTGLERLLKGPYAALIALVVSATVFGLVHLAGGWQYAFLAFLAGLVYGGAYLRSGRVEMAILAHLATNTGAVLFLLPVSS